MSKQTLSTNEQIEKLKFIGLIAKEAAASDDFIRKIGAVALYAGLVDFFVIQVARLVEQVILKAQLEAGKEPKFSPRPDSYFYDNRVDTRRILQVVKKEVMPFREVTPGSAANADRANALANNFIDKTVKFLNYRNSVIHHLGSPKMTLEKVGTLCDKSILAYEDLQYAHTVLCMELQPYRFGDKELRYFYGST
jgi:hypothetical protein